MTNPDLKTVSDEAVDDLIRAMNDHIWRRVHYDRDGPSYAGENPPNQDELAKALSTAILAVVRAAIIGG